MTQLLTYNEYLHSAIAASSTERISAIAIYYVYKGRNAWWSTWSTRYSQGCMHSSLESAKMYCEPLRVQGTVFYIKLLPAIQIISKNGCVVVTQINTDSPLANFLPEFTNNKKNSSYKENIIYNKSNVSDIVDLFSPYSESWKIRPPINNSIVSVVSSNPKEEFIDLFSISKLTVYTSFSNGPGYRLGWTQEKYDMEVNHAITIANKYEDSKSRKRKA